MSIHSPTSQRPKATEKSPPSRGLLQRQCACGKHTIAGGECAECANQRGILQRKLAIGSSDDPREQEVEQNLPASVIKTVNGPGQMLDSGVQQDMERHFGTSFSNVRIHTDSDAARSANQVNAAAYAFGEKVVFNHGYYRPASEMGRRLIAHELAHVLQQTRGGVSTEATSTRHEREADQAAQGLDSQAKPFKVQACSARGVSPLTFAELEKKVWAHVPSAAKPYVAPLAREVKAQVEKVVSPQAELPASVVAVVEHPIESTKEAAKNLAKKAKVQVRDYALDKAGTLKGALLEGTAIVDTLIWTGHTIAKNHGLVGHESKSPEISGKFAGVFDKGVEAGTKVVFGELPPEQALIFDSYELGELKGAIGSQVALGFIGVEEVQLALKALGVLGSVRGLVLMLEKPGGINGWYKDPEFIGALVGVALSFLSLKSTKASKKIINIVVNTALASGNLISAGPAVWKLYNDWHRIPENDPKRDKALKNDLVALIKLVANIVVDIIRHQAGKGKSGGKAGMPAEGGEPGPAAAKTTPTEPVSTAKPAAPAPLHETPGAKPAPISPVDAGPANHTAPSAPEARNQSREQWKAKESASRRSKRIDEAVARADADAKRGASTENAEPTPKSGEADKVDGRTHAENPPESTRITKENATAVEPTVNGHEAVVTKQGVGVCSPAPCPVIHLEYAFELKKNPKFKARNDKIQEMRATDPKKAAALAAKLIRDLEEHRQAGLHQEFDDFTKTVGNGEPPVASGSVISMQPHSMASNYREAHSMQGRESAHLAAQALMKQVPGWKKGNALTLLLQSKDHRGAAGLDHFWKNDMDALRQRRPSGTAKAKDLYAIFSNAVDKTKLPPGEKSSIKARLFDEMFVDNGMNPDVEYTIPRGYRK